MSEQRPGPVDYWKPHASLSGLVTGYHRYHATLPPGAVLHDAFFPGWATIRIALPGSDDWSVKLGARTYNPVPRAAFFGPTSHAGYVSTSGGTLVGVGLLPLGWATLFGGDVSRLANRVVSLDQLDAGADTLMAALAEQDDPRPVLNAWLNGRLAQRPAADPRIGQLHELLETPTFTRAEQLAEALGMSPRALAALTRYNFGFTPKLLLRRGRFVRALGAMLANPKGSKQLLDDSGYWDRSHFLRDSHLFLGCSLREFNKRRGPLNPIAMRVREAVIGAAV